MQFSELKLGERFRCSIFDEHGNETIADCVKLSSKRFRRLDSGKYIKPELTTFSVSPLPGATTMQKHNVSGKELLKLLSQFPADVYPSGVTETETAMQLDGVDIDNSARYNCWSCNANLPVHRIDSDWSIERVCGERINNVKN